MPPARLASQSLPLAAGDVALPQLAQVRGQKHRVHRQQQELQGRRAVRGPGGVRPPRRRAGQGPPHLEKDRHAPHSEVHARHGVEEDEGGVGPLGPDAQVGAVHQGPRLRDPGVHGVREGEDVAHLAGGVACDRDQVVREEALVPDLHVHGVVQEVADVEVLQEDRVGEVGVGPERRVLRHAARVLPVRPDAQAEGDEVVEGGYPGAALLGHGPRQVKRQEEEDGA
mmetsp:Transcript_81929/g.244323  ORF Transcript_81929/g.244323 Transcript_81929/m.244323 type:complete len:226 (-) Transcript_81929:117-794(-)